MGEPTRVYISGDQAGYLHETFDIDSAAQAQSALDNKDALFEAFEARGGRWGREYFDRNLATVKRRFDKGIYKDGDLARRRAKIQSNDYSRPGPSGNTVGVVVPKTSPNPAPPNTQPETEQESQWEKFKQGSKEAAQYYKDHVSGSLHNLSGQAMDKGGDAVMAGEVIAGGGVLVGATGVGAPVGAGMVVGGEAMAAAGGVVAMAGAVGESAAATLDIAADWALTGQMPDLVQAAKNLGMRLLRGLLSKKLPKGKPGRAAAAPRKPAAKPNKPPNKPPPNKRGGNVKRRKPHKNCGKIVLYRDKATFLKTGLQKDHAPSKAALIRATEKRIAELKSADIKISKSQKEMIIDSVVNGAPTIGVPFGAHMDGRTWGWKNIKEQIFGDAGDLNKAARDDLRAMSKVIKNGYPSCSKAYNKSATELRKIDWNKYINKSINDVIKSKGKR